jgi:hypothetical protein
MILQRQVRKVYLQSTVHPKGSLDRCAARNFRVSHGNMNALYSHVEAMLPAFVPLGHGAALSQLFTKVSQEEPQKN